jgi:hypothetical protein
MWFVGVGSSWARPAGYETATCKPGTTEVCAWKPTLKRWQCDTAFVTASPTSGAKAFLVADSSGDVCDDSLFCSFGRVPTALGDVLYYCELDEPDVEHVWLIGTEDPDELYFHYPEAINAPGVVNACSPTQGSWDGASISAKMLGNGDSDYLHGGSCESTETCSEVIYGDGGIDEIRGHGGVDELHGGTGDDLIYGGPGSDTIFGGDDDDWICAGGDNDTVLGDGGDDSISGDCDVWLDSTSFDDDISGGPGVDHVCGGPGDDNINGGTGDDRLDQNTYLTTARMVDGGPDGPIGDRCSPHEGPWSMNCEIEEPGDFACPAEASDSDPSYL